MPLFIYEAAYTPESIAAQIKEPQDRIQVVKPAFEAAGAKILASGYLFGDYDVMAMFEAPSDEVAASLALAVAAGGAVKAARTTKVLDGAQWVAALKGAQKISGAYKPAK